MAEAKLTVVLKADEALKAKLKMFYQDDLCEKTPQYAIFQAKADDCTITLYQSGKLMFQGKRAEEESKIWTSLGSTELPPKAAKKSTKTCDLREAGKFCDDTAVGSDEVGTGDFFGPIVVTAAYVKREQFDFLKSIGVRDSKKVTDEKICKMAPEIIAQIPHVTKVLSNPEYNQMRDRGINMNQVKAILHNEVLHQLLKEPQTETKLVVVDQFEPPAAYYRHLQDEKEVVNEITFMTKAEDKCMAVACGSIISRYVFLGEMKRLGQELGYPEGLPFGAGAGVDSFGAMLIEDHGEEMLAKVAKMNFANVEKVRKLYAQTR